MPFIYGDTAVRGIRKPSAARWPARLPKSACGPDRIDRPARGRILRAGVAAGFLLLATGLGLAGGQPGATKPSDAPPPKAKETGSPATAPTGGPAALPAQAIARFGTPFPRQARPIRFCGYTRDGRTLVTAGLDGVYLWDPETGTELRRLTGAGLAILTADLSADGTRLATLSRGEGFARVYDVPTGRKVGELAVPARPPGFARVCLSPEGKKLAYFCYREPRVLVFDVTSGTQLVALDAAKKRVWDAAFLPDGNRLVSGGDDQTIRVWDAATGKLDREIGGDLGEIGRIAVSPGGDRLATISQHPGDVADYVWHGDDFIRLWDAKTGKVIRHLRVPPGTSHLNFEVGLNALAFTPDGKRLVAGGVDRVTRVWDAATGEEVRQFPEPAGIPGRLAVSPDGKRLAVVTATAEPIARPGPPPAKPGLLRHTVVSVLVAPAECFHLRDLETGRDPGPTSHAGAVVISTLSPDGRLVATSSSGPEIQVWEAATGRRLRQLDGHEKEIVALAWAEGGRTLLSAGLDRTVRTWDAATGKEVRKVPARGNVKTEWRSGPRGRAEFSPDGKLLCVVDENGGVIITETATGKEAHSLGVRAGAACHVGFSAAGGTLLITTTDSLVYSWDTREGLELRSCELRDPGYAPYLLFQLPGDAAMAPDGKVFVVNRVDGTLVMIETGTDRVLRLLSRQDPGPGRLAISPDGHTLAWGGGSRDPRILLYEMSTGTVRHALAGHADRVLSLSFSSDGSRLLSGSADGTALLWDLSGRAATPAEVALRPRELDALWADLVGDDAERAYRAVRSLAASPKSSVPFLRGLLAPAGRADEGRTSRLREERAVEALQLAGTPEAWKVVEEAAGGEPSAGRTQAARAALATRPGRAR
jgi:WD40 repeat protein